MIWANSNNIEMSMQRRSTYMFGGPMLGGLYQFPCPHGYGHDARHLFRTERHGYSRLLTWQARMSHPAENRLLLQCPFCRDAEHLNPDMVGMGTETHELMSNGTIVKSAPYRITEESKGYRKRQCSFVRDRLGYFLCVIIVIVGASVGIPYLLKFYGIIRDSKPLAVFLSDTGTNGPADPHRFQNQSDYDDNYNFRTGELIIPSKGLYFFSLSAGASPNSRVNFSLVASASESEENQVVDLPSYDVSVLRTHTACPNRDTLSRDIIFHLEKDVRIHAVSSETLISGTARTSLTAFSITDITYGYQPAWFLLAKTSGRQERPGKVEFPDVIADSEQGWSEKENAYTCPEDGIYVFSFSLYVNVRDKVFAELRVGNKIYELVRSGTFSQAGGSDVISRNVLSSCIKGDAVYVYLRDGAINGGPAMTTSLAGFRYRPENSSLVYWSMSNNGDFRGEDKGDRVIDYKWGRVDLRTDDLVFDGRDGAYTSVTCPQNGWYFVYLTGIAMAKRRMSLTFYVEDLPQAILYRSDPWQGRYIDYMGRGAILKCNKGNRISVKLYNTSNYGVGKPIQNSANVYGTSFHGFLVYRDNKL